MAISNTHFVSALLIVVCVLIALTTRNSPMENQRSSKLQISSSSLPTSSINLMLSSKAYNGSSALRRDYYSGFCPEAESIIQAVVEELFLLKPRLAPALLRLVFHDCFIEGCDASVLLDGSEGVESEKTAVPNRSLKGFEAIEILKAEVERACPGVVSCADILVLATRDAVFLAGGPHYDLSTGRRDSPVPFHDIAEQQLPAPSFNLSQVLSSFSARGFTVRETVSLLGSHSIGSINCQFLMNRLTNFAGTGSPDPSITAEFLKLMRTICNVSAPPEMAPAPGPSVPSSSAAPLRPFSFSISPAHAPLMDKFLSSLPEPVMSMAYHQEGLDFGASFYQSLLDDKGIIFSDQELIAGKESLSWVNTYALNNSLFQQDFASAMVKLSNLQVLTAPRGQIRRSCSTAI